MDVARFSHSAFCLLAFSHHATIHHYAWAETTAMDNDALTITTITQPANGTATVVAGTHIRYTPPTDFVGTALVNYTLSNNHGGSATSTHILTVAPREYVFLPTVQR